MFTLDIKTDNAAFENERWETARILHALAAKISETSLTGGVLRDSNGNNVGWWKFTVDKISVDTLQGQIDKVVAALVGMQAIWFAALWIGKRMVDRWLDRKLA